MTTDRQRRANARNAQKSSGPKTEAGQARSAQNARKHGLSSAAPVEATLAWFRLIIDEPTASLDPFDGSPRKQAAIKLAAAEVQLARALKAERDHIAEFNARVIGHSEADFAVVNDRDLDPMEQLMRLVNFDWASHYRAQAERLQNEQAWPLSREGRLLRRYRREAESRRRRALRDWIALNGEIPKRTRTQPEAA
ncbi:MULTISPECIES: hypothetical protein [unclassified Roseitalea]|uniref:hypothetical protein n=1 Tax=unclassified Roseitalea TaxID=2639107 RepID=UPI00273E5AC3|nr:MULTISPECIES: hypothetical protein [unclassified Roseitalea]